MTSIEFVREVIGWQKQHAPLIVVDPVMGDNGQFYGPMSPSMVDGMRSLIRDADVITPNLTEAAILLGHSYRQDLSGEEALLWAKELSRMGAKRVAITSVLREHETCVVSYDALNGEEQVFRQDQLPVTYPGCGDLFASILTGKLLRGCDFFAAVSRSAQLVKRAIEVSYEQNVPVSHGVSVERIRGDMLALS